MSELRKFYHNISLRAGLSLAIIALLLSVPTLFPAPVSRAHITEIHKPRREQTATYHPDDDINRALYGGPSAAVMQTPVTHEEQIVSKPEIPTHSLKSPEHTSENSQNHEHADFFEKLEHDFDAFETPHHLENQESSPVAKEDPFEIELTEEDFQQINDFAEFFASQYAGME